MINGMGNHLEEVRIYRYCIPFKRPLRVGSETLENREGLVIELVDESGAKGYGEIAPLPGFSRETLEQAQQQVKLLAEKLPGMPLLEQLPDPPLYPAVLLGMETAIVNLLKSHFKEAFADGIEQKPLKSIEVNGLLHTTAAAAESLDEPVKQLLEQGFKTIKIKVARTRVAEDIARINRVASMLPPGSWLRLDANQRWDYQQALDFAKGVSAVKDVIEYIEEPFAAGTPGHLEAFYRATGIPTALDESLEALDPAAAVIPGGVAAIVLKPTLLGGFSRIMGFIGLARQHQIKPVISSCFEVGPGFVELCRIVLTIDFVNTAAGLDTLGYLKGNLIKKPLTITGGAISIESLRDITDLYDLDQMERIQS